MPFLLEPQKVYILVMGQSVPKQSFRVQTKTGKFHGYTSTRVTDWADTIAKEAMVAMIRKELLEGEIKVSILFVLKDKRRVDLDNLSKNVLDSLKGIVYKDDSSIVELLLRKRVEKNPYIIIIVEEQNVRGDSTYQYLKYVNRAKKDFLLGLSTT